MYALEELKTQLRKRQCWKRQEAATLPLLNDRPLRIVSPASAVVPAIHTASSLLLLFVLSNCSRYISVKVVVEGEDNGVKEKDGNHTHSLTHSVKVSIDMRTNCSAGHNDTASRYNGLRRVECVGVIVCLSTNDVYSKGSYLVKEKEKKKKAILW